MILSRCLRDTTHGPGDAMLINQRILVVVNFRERATFRSGETRLMGTEGG